MSRVKTRREAPVLRRPPRGLRPETRIRLLVDCDNTLGISRHEIDDGLALLLLLALERRGGTHGAGVELVGVTTTFGNGPEDAVYASTRKLLDRANRNDIPVRRGARHAGDSDTEAARFICRLASEYPGELVILSIGPVTNLASALARDPRLAGNLKQVFIMGGYLRPLRFPRREVAELNLSSDSAASATVLRARCEVSLASAQLCLQARYGLRHLLLDLIRAPWLAGTIAEWFVAFGIHTGTVGFYLWDLVPALAMLCPGRLAHRTVRLTSTETDLATGTLCFEEAPGIDARSSGIIDLPSRIRHRFRFAGECARLWSRVHLRGSLRPMPYPAGFRSPPNRL